MNAAPQSTDIPAPQAPQDDAAQAPEDDAVRPETPETPAPTVGHPTDASAPGNPWRRALWSSLAVWLAAMVAHFAASLYTWSANGRQPPRLLDLLTAGNQWDSVHYLKIAAQGYRYWEGAPAFFPLYPLTVRFADAILPQGQMVAGLAVAHLCAFGSLLLMHRLAEFEFGPEIAKRATFYLAVFPASFFLFAVYNESMFIMLSLGALYFARRGNWWVAGAFGALTTATRMFGILLILPMALEYLRQRGRRGIRSDVLSIALVPVGLGAFAAYCWHEFGNPMQFSAAQNVWQREYVWPGEALIDSARSLSGGHLLTRPALGTALELFSMLLAIALLVLAVVGPWKLRRDQFYLVAYGAVGILLLSSMEIHWGSILQSAPRLILETIPIFLVLARMGANQFVDRLVVMVGLSLQSVLLVMFMSGTFVA